MICLGILSVHVRRLKCTHTVINLQSTPHCTDQTPNSIFFFKNSYLLLGLVSEVFAISVNNVHNVCNRVVVEYSVPAFNQSCQNDQ